MYQNNSDNRTDSFTLHGFAFSWEAFTGFSGHRQLSVGEVDIKELREWGVTLKGKPSLVGYGGEYSMVTYLPTTASRSITVLVSEVGTTLTIDAPTTVIQGQIFIIEGQLTRNDTGATIPNARINISYNGNLLGSTLTNMEGYYSVNTSLIDTGTFTLTASFAGMTVAGLTFGATSASRGIGLGEPNMLPLLVLAGIFAYTVMKK